MSSLQQCFGSGISNPLYPNISPMAVYYNGKTYIVFQGVALNPYIVVYDHTTKEFSVPKYVGYNPFKTDDHGVPSICIDRFGYIHVFFGCHSTPMKHVVSVYPEDVSSFVPLTDPATQATYPNPVKLDSGDIILFYRGTLNSHYTRERYVKSTDNGISWSLPDPIIDAGQGTHIYTGMFELEGTKIHIVWACIEESVHATYRLNVYYAYLNTTDGHLYNISDVDLGTTIDLTEAKASCLVYNSGSNNCWSLRVHVLNGVPHILFHVGSGSTFNWMFTKWTGSAWLTPVSIGAVFDDEYGSGDLKVISANNLEAVLITSGNAGRGGDVEKWVSGNGGTSWSKSETIIEEDSGYAFNFAWYVFNGISELEWIVTETKTGDYSTYLKGYAYGTYTSPPSTGKGIIGKGGLGMGRIGVKIIQ